MTSLLSQLLLISFFSTGVALLLGWLVFQLRYLPAFWASAIAISVAVLPLAKGIEWLLPTGFVSQWSQQGINGEFPALFQQAAVAAINSEQTAAMTSIWFVAFYAIVATFLVLRLFISRWHAVNVANKARAVKAESGHQYFVCQQHCPPFAIRTALLSAEYKVVIPQVLADTLTAQEIDLVITHELAHIANGDDEKGFVIRLLAAVLWANPLIHVVVKRWVHSTEYWADAAVTAERFPEFRNRYAKTLLCAFRLTATRVWQYPAASFSINHLRNEKMRIGNIMHGPQPKFKRASHRRKLLVIGGLITAFSATAVAATVVQPSPVTEWILQGRLSSDYGFRSHPMKQGKKHHHNGIDVAAPLGTPLHAPDRATVIEATDLYQGKSGYGKVVVLETADGVRTLFSHLDSYNVSKGQTIARGMAFANIGETGKATGPHVHIETFVNGERVDPETVWPIHVQKGPNARHRPWKYCGLNYWC